MSIRIKLLAVVGALSIVGGLSTVSPMAASAGTPQCGAGCINIFSQAWGTSASPNFVETVRHVVARAGTPTELFRVSGSNPAEDLIPHGGLVSSFFASGMVSAAVNSHYGTLHAAQIEYAPLGVPTGLCSALPQAPYQNEGLTLEPCTIPGRTVWIIDPNYGTSGSFALINGANTEFVHPIAMTYVHNPARFPFQIRADHLLVSGNGKVPQNQLWGSTFGPLSN